MNWISDIWVTSQGIAGMHRHLCDPMSKRTAKRKSRKRSNPMLKRTRFGECIQGSISWYFGEWVRLLMIDCDYCNCPSKHVYFSRVLFFFCVCERFVCIVLSVVVSIISIYYKKISTLRALYCEIKSVVTSSLRFFTLYMLRQQTVNMASYPLSYDLLTSYKNGP